MIDQVTSLRKRGVTEYMLSSRPGVSKEMLVTAVDVSNVWCTYKVRKLNYAYRGFTEKRGHA